MCRKEWQALPVIELDQSAWADDQTKRWIKSTINKPLPASDILEHVVFQIIVFKSIDLTPTIV